VIEQVGEKLPSPTSESREDSSDGCAARKTEGTVRAREGSSPGDSPGEE
jgi:hypothetical protein